MQLDCDIYVSNMYHRYTHFTLAAPKRSFAMYMLCLFQRSVTNTRTIERYRREFSLHPIPDHEVLLNAWRGPEALF